MFRGQAVRGYRLNQQLRARCLAVAVTALLFFICMSTVLLSQRVTSDEAVERFVELSGGLDVTVVQHSNNWPITGDPQHVTYDLLIDGRPAAGQCEDRFQSEVVCRIEGAGVAEDIN